MQHGAPSKLARLGTIDARDRTRHRSEASGPVLARSEWKHSAPRPCGAKKLQVLLGKFGKARTADAVGNRNEEQHRHRNTKRKTRENPFKALSAERDDARRRGESDLAGAHESESDKTEEAATCTRVGNFERQLWCMTPGSR